MEMATRCSITIRDEYGKEYRIYRHCDGYPEGVVSDLQIFMSAYDRSPVESPEYFLANFIFYAKLALWERYKKKKRASKPWEFNYGVCSPNCEHGDLEYKYLIYPKDGKVMLKIERFSYETMSFKEIFNGEIEKAFERWAESGGCHLEPELLY